MDLVYPKQTDEYDVDIFNNNFKKLKNTIDNNEINTANNLAQKASQADVDDMRDTFEGACDTLSENAVTEEKARAVADNKLQNAIKDLINVIYVKASDTPAAFTDINTDYNMIYSSLSTAISNAYEGCEVVLLPGTHTITTPLNLENAKNITVRGFADVYRNDCIINYTGSVTMAVRIHGATNLILKDFTLKAIGATSCCIGGAQLNNIILKNLYLYGGGVGLCCVATSGYNYTADNIDVINCIFKQVTANGIYGKRNVFISLSPAVEGSVIRIEGNISLNEAKAFYYTIGIRQINNVYGNLNGEVG